MRKYILKLALKVETVTSMGRKEVEACDQKKDQVMMFSAGQEFSVMKTIQRRVLSHEQAQRKHNFKDKGPVKL